MIRVNLLPNAADRRSAPESNQTWLLLIMLAVVIESVGLTFFHRTKEDELAGVRSETTKVTSQISDIQERVKDHAKIKAELEELRAREDAIAKLQAGRKGPTAVMLEMSKLLTQGQGPTVDEEKLEKLRRDNPNAIYNPSWEAKRIWLTNYAETQRSVRLEGVARDGSDVYEFAQRLKLSQYFDKVTLLSGESRKRNKIEEVELVSFALQVKVNY